MGRVTYEWVVEEVDEHGDIQDTDCWDTAADALRAMQHSPEDGLHYEWGLVRDTWDAADPCDLVLRQWAYVTDDSLPHTMDEGATVPKRFHAELSTALRKAA